MKRIVYEVGSVVEAEIKAEQFLKIPIKSEVTWQSIAEAVNKEMGFGEDEYTEPYTEETIQEEYPDHLQIYRDGVVLMYL